MARYVSIRHSGSWAQIPTSSLCLALLLPSAAVLAAVALQPWMSMTDLLRAPSPTVPLASGCCDLLAGAIAKLGAMLWIVSASVCLFTAVLAHATVAARRTRSFFVTAGLVSAAIGFDALLRVSTGAPSGSAWPPMTRALLAAGLAAYLLLSWRFILSGRASLLLVAGFALGASIAIGASAPGETPLWMFAADGCGFLGAVFWGGFHIVAAMEAGEAFTTGRVTTVELSPERLLRRAA